MPTDQSRGAVGTATRVVQGRKPRADLEQQLEKRRRELAEARKQQTAVWVKHFQAIHHASVDVAHALALLFGLGIKALPSWDSKTRWNNLRRDLAV